VVLLFGYLWLLKTVFLVSKDLTFGYFTRLTVRDVHMKYVIFDRLLSPHNVCQDPVPFLVIYVHSAPGHLEQRTLIRKTYANPSNTPGLVVRTFFVIGFSQLHQNALLQENAMYGDILQENYIDSYKNLSLKALSAMRYISSHCQFTHFVLKADDDIFVNIFALVRHLRASELTPPKSISCLVWPYMPVMRDPNSKWYVSPEEWPQDAYTDYCSGSAFIISVPAISTMLQVLPLTPYHWVDDFYITGILADAAQVTKTSIHPLYRLNFNQFIQEFKKSSGFGTTILFSHAKDLKKFKIMWNRLAQLMNGVTVAHIWKPVLN
jgi:beta-1,3-galactosyltransferase 1